MKTRLSFAIALILLCAYAVFTHAHPLSISAELMVSFVILIAFLALGRGKKAVPITFFLMTFAQLRYVIWRVNCTLILDTFSESLASSVFLFADICCTLFIINGTFHFWHRRPDDRIYEFQTPDPLTDHPSVDILITTHKEPVDIVRRTIAGALSVSYANKAVHLLDDGNREEMRILADEMRVNYISRTKNTDYKAGNLNNALRQTSGDFILSLDADHICASTIIDYALPAMLSDPEIGILQFAHRSYNPSIIDRTLRYRGFSTELASAFYVYMPSLTFWQGTFWIGSGAVLRRKALDAIGGICTGTVSEDLHTTYKLAESGWKTAYIPIPQILALSPETLSAVLTQQKRWFTGTMQLNFGERYWRYKNLTLSRRVFQLSHMIGSWSFLPRLIWIATPILFILFHVFPARMQPLDFVIAWLPVFYLSIRANMFITRNNSSPVIFDLLDTLKIPALISALFALLMRGLIQPFHSTPKGVNYTQDLDWRLSVPYVVLLTLALVAAINFTVHYLPHPDLSFPILIFSWYYVFLLAAAVCISLEKPQPLSMHTVPVDLPLTISIEESQVEGRLIRISESGATILVKDSKAQTPPIDLETDERFEITFGNQDCEWRENVRFIGQRRTRSGDSLLEVSFIARKQSAAEFTNFIRLTISENKSWQVAPNLHDSTVLVGLISTPFRQLACGLRKLASET